MRKNLTRTASSEIQFVGARAYRWTEDDSTSNHDVQFDTLEGGGLGTLQEGDFVVAGYVFAKYQDSTDSNNITMRGVSSTQVMNQSMDTFSSGGGAWRAIFSSCEYGFANATFVSDPEVTFRCPFDAPFTATAVILAFRGVDSSDPLYATTAANTRTGASGPNPPPNDFASNGMCVSFGSGYTQNSAYSLPSDMEYMRSIRGDSTTSVSRTISGMSYTPASGTFNPVSWSSGFSSQYMALACTLSLQPEE